MKSFSVVYGIAGLISATVLGFGCHREAPMSSLKMGSMVDNGGDTITCSHDAELQASGAPYYEGIFTYDYFLTIDPHVGDADDLVGSTWEDYRQQVSSFIEAKLPFLSTSFNQYMDLLENRDNSQFRIWEASDLDLSDLHDEGPIHQLPRNCKVERDGQSVPDLRQMVRRRYVDGAQVQKIFYYYDFPHFSDLRQNRPLQFSYLAVHEWLWDFVDFPWINRAINRVIHSRSGQNLSTTEFQDYLRSFGIEVASDGFISTVGVQERPVRNGFQASPYCRYERRLSAEFLTASQYVILAPGEERELTVQVPEHSNNVGQQICGTALMISHKTVGGGSATLEMDLSRSIPHVPLTLSVGPSLTQSSFTGICQDRQCGHRSGELNRLLLFINNFLGSTWKLKVKNTSTTTGVEIRLPYLLFVDMRE